MLEIQEIVLHFFGNQRKKLAFHAILFFLVSKIINHRTYEGGGCHPHKVFLEFFSSKTNYYLDLPFSEAVCISLRHILTQVW